MPPKAAHYYKTVQVFKDFAKPIERLGWKNQDSEQFCEKQLQLLKSLAKATTKLTKSFMRMTLLAAKLGISNAEADLFVEKIKGAVQYIRRRIRDSGSGKFLPAACQALLKIWSRQFTKVGKSKKKAVKDMKLETEEKPQSLRDIFGLGKKQKPTCLDLVSPTPKSEDHCNDDDDDDDDIENISDATSSTSAPKPSGATSSTAAPKTSAPTSSTAAPKPSGPTSSTSAPKPSGPTSSTSAPKIAMTSGSSSSSASGKGSTCGKI